MSLVLDSSVASSWCFKDEETPNTVASLRAAAIETLFVPSVWFVETANVPGLARKTGRLSPADLTASVNLPNAFEIRPDAQMGLKGSSILLPLMQTYDLTAYDATHLELALRLNLPSATLDKKLIAAAHVAGVSLFPDAP